MCVMMSLFLSMSFCLSLEFESLVSRYWQNGHPLITHFGAQNCAAFNSFNAGMSDWSVKSWSSELCAQSLRWVCERQADS